MSIDIKTFSFKEGLQVEFEIKDISEIRKLPKIFSRPHKTTFYQVIWINEGEALFHIDFREIKISAGDLLIVSVNQIIKFDLSSTTMVR